MVSRKRKAPARMTAPLSGERDSEWTAEKIAARHRSKLSNNAPSGITADQAVLFHAALGHIKPESKNLYLSQRRSWVMTRDHILVAYNHVTGKFSIRWADTLIEWEEGTTVEETLDSLPVVEQGEEGALERLKAVLELLLEDPSPQDSMRQRLSDSGATDAQVDGRMYRTEDQQVVLDHLTHGNWRSNDVEFELAGVLYGSVLVTGTGGAPTEYCAVRWADSVDITREDLGRYLKEMKCEHRLAEFERFMQAHLPPAASDTPFNFTSCPDGCRQCKRVDEMETAESDDGRLVWRDHLIRVQELPEVGALAIIDLEESRNEGVNTGNEHLCKGGLKRWAAHFMSAYGDLAKIASKAAREKAEQGEYEPLVLELAVKSLLWSSKSPSPDFFYRLQGIMAAAIMHLIEQKEEED